MSNQQIEEKRRFWSNIAKEYGWYKKPFYVQVWIDPDTQKVWNSVSTIVMKEDIIIYEKETV